MEFPNENIYLQWMDDSGNLLPEITWSNEQAFKYDLVFRRDDAPGYDYALEEFNQLKGE